MRLRAPRFRSRSEYGASLGDAVYWSPYVREMLRRHGLPLGQLEVGAVGTFPTILVREHVVKLFLPTLAKPFGTLFNGTLCHAVEVEILGMLAGQAVIPGPRLVAHGCLFDDDLPWPYLVMTRVHGTSWADARMTFNERLGVARELGAVVRRIHALPPPDGPLWAPDWIAEHRRDCVERQRGWGTLPSHLIDQIAGYLWTAPAERRLVHADLHADHLLVAGGRLIGILDWGDAIVADPYYELPALHLHAFDADPELLAAFLAGYGWPSDGDFVRRAMSMTLLREFDVMDGVARRVDLGRVGTLAELAELVWRVGSPGQ